MSSPELSVPLFRSTLRRSRSIIGRVLFALPDFRIPPPFIIISAAKRTISPLFPDHLHTESIIFSVTICTLFLTRYFLWALIWYELLVQIKVKRADAGGIELEGSKVYDLVLADIVDNCTAEVMAFEFSFSDTGGRNSLDPYRCSIYYYFDSVFNTIIISQTQINCLPVANRELDDWRKKNREWVLNLIFERLRPMLGCIAVWALQSIIWVRVSQHPRSFDRMSNRLSFPWKKYKALRKIFTVLNIKPFDRTYLNNNFSL